MRYQQLDLPGSLEIISKTCYVPSVVLVLSNNTPLVYSIELSMSAIESCGRSWDSVAADPP